jgi:hypothetical protein
LQTKYYIDDSEISNNEYRQFVYWVRDSIARKLLAFGSNGNAEDFQITQDDFLAMWPVYKGDNNLQDPYINWDKKINWNSDDDDYRADLQPMYLPEGERFYNRKEIDARKLNYEYYRIDIRLAASKSNRFIPQKSLDIQDATRSINEALDLTSKMIEEDIKKICISINGVHITSHLTSGKVAISRGDGEVTEEDKNRVITNAEKGPNYCNLDHFMRRVAFKMKGYNAPGDSGKIGAGPPQSPSPHTGHLDFKALTHGRNSKLTWSGTGQGAHCAQLSEGHHWSGHTQIECDEDHKRQTGSFCFASPIPHESQRGARTKT